VHNGLTWATPAVVADHKYDLLARAFLWFLAAGCCHNIQLPCTTLWYNIKSPARFTLVHAHTYLLFVAADVHVHPLPSNSLALNGNQFIGTIPWRSWSQLGKLQELDLSSNRLTGTISPAVGDLTSIVGLSLHNNLLSGLLPPELSKLGIVVLLLHSNRFTGPLIPEFKNWTSAIQVRLDSNMLTGSLPAEYASVKSVTLLGGEIIWWDNIRSFNASR
jgi:hypothetical protein